MLAMRCVVVSMLLGFFCAVLAQEAPANHGAMPDSPAAVEAGQKMLAASLEGRVGTAWEMFKRRDTEGYAEFLTDEFQAVEADGEGERSKPRVLREVARSMYTAYSLQLFQVQPLGPDHAFVTYEATIQFPAGAAARYKRVFVSELWTERGGQWKMMRYQETSVR